MKCPYCNDTGKIDRRSLAGKMRAYRAERRIGVREAATCAGISFSTWARAERSVGELNPHNAAMVRVLLRNY
jgi:hypothetical protein